MRDDCEAVEESASLRCGMQKKELADSAKLSWTHLPGDVIVLLETPERGDRTIVPSDEAVITPSKLWVHNPLLPLQCHEVECPNIRQRSPSQRGLV
jgi:hypothetical protein